MGKNSFYGGNKLERGGLPPPEPIQDQEPKKA